MISKSREERLRYESRRKAILTYLSDVAEARKEGYQKGRWIGRIQVLQDALGDDVATIENFQSWDLERLQHEAEALQARLREKVKVNPTKRKRSGPS